MPVHYRETVLEPHSQKTYQTVPPGGQWQQQQQQGGAGQQPQPPQQRQQQYSSSVTEGGGAPGAGPYQRVESGNWPANFPRIPPPKGVVDDAELERMAALLMKGAAAGGGGGTGGGQWEAQPGWTRQTQQSYTIETVVSEMGPITRGGALAPPHPVEKVPQSGPMVPPHQQQQSAANAQKSAPPTAQRPQQPVQQQQQPYSVTKSVGGGPRQQPQPQQHGPMVELRKQHPPGQPQQPKMPEKRQQPPAAGDQWSQFSGPGAMDFVQHQGRGGGGQQPAAPPQQQQKQPPQPLMVQQPSEHPYGKAQQPPPTTQTVPTGQKQPAAQGQQQQSYYVEEFEWSERQAPQQNGHPAEQQPKYQHPVQQPQQQQPPAQKQRQPAEPQYHQIEQKQAVQQPAHPEPQQQMLLQTQQPQMQPKAQQPQQNKSQSQTTTRQQFLVEYEQPREEEEGGQAEADRRGPAKPVAYGGGQYPGYTVMPYGQQYQQESAQQQAQDKEQQPQAQRETEQKQPAKQQPQVQGGQQVQAGGQQVQRGQQVQTVKPAQGGQQVQGGQQSQIEQQLQRGQQSQIEQQQQSGGGTTTIYYEQKSTQQPKAPPPATQTEERRTTTTTNTYYQGGPPSQQQKQTAGEQPQRKIVVGQQRKEGGQESDGGTDEPPPEMQLAQADPERLKEQQQQLDGQQPARKQQQSQQQQYYQYGWDQQQPPQQNGAQQHQRNFQEPLYVSAQQPPDWTGEEAEDHGQWGSAAPRPYQYQHFQPPQDGTHQYYSPSSAAGGWEAVYGDDWAYAHNPPSFTTGPAWADQMAYGQRVNVDRRRAESEQRRRNHSPVPGSAEHGYLFGGMDFVDHQQFDPYTYVEAEPWPELEERLLRSRRDLHWGPPRRRGDFFGLDYTTMPGGEQPARPLSAEDALHYQGYQPLPPRKNFRLCGHITADPEAPLNIAEAQGLNELDSQYWVGDTLSNQKILVDHPLTDEEKRTFALLYGPGGFKPEHRTVHPEPKPEEPVQFSVTIGPRKEYERAAPPEGYVNPMKVEGESWILGNRDIGAGYYGGHPSLHAPQSEHLPFHRPRQFPAHVPQWARQRMQHMGRGARSLDRSVFMPAWTKVPQPQPPFWVKRDGSGAAGGFKFDEQGGQGQQQQQQEQQQKAPAQFGRDQEEEAGQIEEEAQKPVEPQQQKQPTQAVAKQQQQQQFGGQQNFAANKAQIQPQQKVSSQMNQQQRQQKQEPQQQQLNEQEQEKYQQQTSQQQQISQQKVQQPAQQQKNPPEAAAGGVQYQQQQNQPLQTGGGFSRTMQQIHKQPAVQAQQQPPQKGVATGPAAPPAEAQWSQFSQPGGMDYAQRRQPPEQGQPQPKVVKAQFGQPKAGAAPNYQLIVNPPKSHQGGIVPAKQPLTERQEQQKQQQEQQDYYAFYEGGKVGGVQRQQQQKPQQTQQQKESAQQGGQWGNYQSVDYRQGGGQSQGGQPAPRVWSTNQTTTRVVQQGAEVPLNEETSGLENLAKMKLGEFPLKQRSLEGEQNGGGGNNNMFVDAHGRPVQYVRETRLDPASGQPVTREEWRLVDQQQQQQPKGYPGGYQFRQTSSSTMRRAEPQQKGGNQQQAQWTQFTQPGGMNYSHQ